GTAFAHWHVRGDVHAGVQPGQFVADGADDFYRVCGRRRDCDDREHLALSRGRRYAAAGGAEGCGTDWVHDSIADGFADRGADPAAVHGRCGGAAVPRVRHDAGGDDRDFGRGVTDADANDVLEDSAARSEGAGREVL